ncbi:MAG: S8 family serine peptidase, partial [Bacteroidaceae bacterium]
RSEEESTESLYEMDTYAAALEYADSVGVQLINSSLGYFSFDDSRDDIRLRDLDGQTTLISRQASMVASKGILLICSAGNSGDDSWKKITPPADARDILVVGAVRKDSLLADFSSIGCTADGRIVPTIVTQGEDLAVMSSNGWVIHASGTSFAAPQIAAALACLMQAYPDISPKEWIRWVELCSDRVDFPNNIYGYGIPDFEKLCILLQKQQIKAIPLE